MINFIRIWLISFVLLFIITVPFPIHSITHPGLFLEPFLVQLEETICHFIGLKFIFQHHFYSDSVDLTVHLTGLFFISLILGLSLNKHPCSTRIGQLWLPFLSYVLAFFLFKYGCDKLFKIQFYYPEPNILFTPFGKLDLDILYWSTIGKSHGYNIFLGIIEIIPGFLLLHSKTRKLGALIAFMVLIHVLMINIFYHIEVKILSSFLVLISFAVLFHYRKELISFFFSAQRDTNHR